MLIRTLLTAAFAVLALAPAPSAAAQGLGPPLIVADSPCAVGEALAVHWMQQGAGERRIFDDQAVMVGSRSHVERPKSLPTALFARWAASPATSLLGACPDARKALDRFGPLATPEDRARSQGVRHGPYLVRISAPIATKSDLIIEVSSQCAGLCGYGGVLHYRKTAKGWVFMGPVMIWFA